MSVTQNDLIAQEVFDRLDAIGNQISTTVPMIWEKMVLLTQAESIAYLAVGFICLVAAIVATMCFSKIKVEDRYGEWPVSKFISLGFMILYIPAAVILFYQWNWVGAFAPEARLIARLIGAVTHVH